MTTLYPSQAVEMGRAAARALRCDDISELPRGLRGLDNLPAADITDLCERMGIPYRGRADGVMRIRRRVRAVLSTLATVRGGH